MARFQVLIKTCEACPSQWEGQLDDDLYLYIRYRWGVLSVGIGETLDEAIGNRNFLEKVGDTFDGVMSTSTMLSYLVKWGLIE